jgi:uncharacterized protein (DUF427 family)
VSLTTGRGPLGKNPAGTFNAPLPDGLVYVEPFRRRVRGVLGGRDVVDTERARLVHRAGLPPSFAFPAADVHGCDTEPEPAAGDGYVRVAWAALDAWFEEDEQVFGHARNPYHRVDCVRTHRRLHVEVVGTVLVDTTDTIGVYETALEPKLYVRRELVVPGVLVPSPTTTYCPYKGTASYWSAVVGDTTVDDVAWSYDDPLPECLPIAGLLSFEAQRATVVTDVPRAD